MSTPDSGGPAFPEQIAVTPTGDTYSGEPGMALRDYFAAQALPGLVTLDMNEAPALKPRKGEDGSAPIARVAYALADAMLAERAK